MAVFRKFFFSYNQNERKIPGMQNMVGAGSAQTLVGMRPRDPPPVAQMQHVLTLDDLSDKRVAVDGHFKARTHLMVFSS